MHVFASFGFRARLMGLMAGCLALGTLSACSKPPRGIETDPSASAPPRQEQTPPPEQAPRDDAQWSVDAEGNTPAVDVAFEEDDLPPAPEDVEGNSLARPPIDVETVDGGVLEEDEGVAPIEGRSVPVEPSVTTPVPSDPAAMTRGFRVQLLASREQADAKRVAREAEGRLQVPTYVVFEAPFYKVRAGDFADRGDALSLRDRARGYGYPNAWVVTTEILAGKGR